MDAGQFNRRVLIQRPTTTQDAIGQPIPGWADVASCWASIKHASGMATIRAGAESSTVKASIRIRYRTDIDASMRVVHGATVYQIKARMPDSAAREFVDLVCEVIA